MALLRYLLLKSLRDSSLVAFVITPALVPAAALIGVTVDRHFTYPFYMNPHYRAVDNAVLASTISMAMAVAFAGIAAFWVLRSEIASRSVNAFVFGLPPSRIALTLVLFGAGIGLAGWLGGLAVSCVLTGAVPPNLLLLALKSVVAFVAGSAVGAFAVAVSPQPAMIVSTYAAAALFITGGGGQQMALAIVISIVFAALAAVLLERRCAT